MRLKRWTRRPKATTTKRGMVDETTKRQQIREWLKDQIEGKGSVDLPELVNKGTDHFLKDEEFVRGLVEDALRPLIYRMGIGIMQASRGERVIELGEEIVAQSEFQKRAKRLQSRWATWMEHAGDRYVRFMEMDKADLITAAEERLCRASTEAAIANFQKLLAGKLKKNERVGDRFTPEQLDDMWDEMSSKEVA